MLEQVAVNTHIEALASLKLTYDQGYIRRACYQGTVDQWMFHVSEIRRVQIQRSRAGMLRIHILLMGGDEFGTPVAEYEHKDKLVLACIALLALRDHELGLEAQTYSDSAYSVRHIDHF